MMIEKKLSSVGLELEERVALEEHLLALSKDRAPRIPRCPEAPDGIPLSFAQQRLWFLEQLEGELTAYNVSSAYRLQGALDVQALRRALESIVQRHEVLRTTFMMRDDQPLQVIGDIERFELLVVDLRALAPGDWEAELVELRRREAEKRFDLTRDLMLRAQLLRLAENEHVLLLTMHHIASDGWSMRVLWRELSTLYDAFCQGSEPELPELPVQYADFAQWQRGQLEGKRLEELLGFWRGQLAGLRALELPTDRVRPPVPSYRGNRYSFRIPSELVAQLQWLARAEGVTLHMTLLAAFQLLLSRYSGREDIAVGTPFAGRNHPDLEGLIGFFVNTLVLRVDLSGEPTFRELLGRVRQASLAAYDHQQLPFEKLVEELQPERDSSRNPLVQVLFQLLNFGNRNHKLGELDVLPMPSVSRKVRFDLEIHLWQAPQTLDGVIVYSTDLFDGGAIERMAGHFLQLLEGIAADPEARIGELPLLTEGERRRMLVEWNDTAADYPRHRCVHQLFEEQVERTPNAVAVVFGDEVLTYGELNERANRLAHHLINKGVGPDVPVGLCVERSMEMVIGLLGILKAGGAYLPLDTGDPRERLEFMLRDGGVEHILTQEACCGQLPTDDRQVVYLDAEAAWVEICEVTNPAPDVDTEHLVYVMFTSGSTGRPKGVAMPHEALVNLIEWHLAHPRLCLPARTLQFASATFDVSFQEMLSTLSSGGSLVLVSETTRRDPQALWRHILEKRVERMFVPYVALQQLAIAAEDGGESILKDIVSAGEALRLTPEIQRLIKGLGGCRMHNHYGPTETHVVTSLLLDEDPASWPGEAPIGRPIANTQAWLLDRQGQPVPVGIPGELYIGGAALARGYLNRPDLTAERFVELPGSRLGRGSDDPVRLYRSGDLCRWRSDGNLEFLGRVDDQIKLRGFRIEPGEIEHALRALPQVNDALMLVREDRPGDRRLTAYLVIDQKNPPGAGEIRKALRATLPDYMIPSAFVPLDAFPLTASGKVDRLALTAPEVDRSTLGTEKVAPRNALEEKLARIWQDVLMLAEEPGVLDSFFDLGGHSLLSASLAAHIEKALNVKLPLRVFFDNPTIDGIVDAIGDVSAADAGFVRAEEAESGRAAGPGQAGSNRERTTTDPARRWPLPDQLYVPLLSYLGGWQGERAFADSLIVGRNTGGPKPPLFWVFQGEREFVQLARYLGPDQPLYGMRSGHLLMSYEEDNIQALALRYVEEILALRPGGSVCVGGNCQASWIALSIAQHLLRHRYPVPLLILMEWSGAFTPYPYPVALLYGEKSEVANPWLRGFYHPERAWRRAFPRYQVDRIPGEHGRFFQEPNIQGLASTVKRCLSEATATAPLFLPKDKPLARIEVVNAPVSLAACQRAALSIKLRNVSSVSWNDPEVSGLMVGNCWRNQDSMVSDCRDGREPIPALAPGESVHLTLSVKAPEETGRFLLVVGVVEEGVAWFLDEESGGVGIPLEVTG